MHRSDGRARVSGPADARWLNGGCQRSKGVVRRVATRASLAFRIGVALVAGLPAVAAVPASVAAQAPDTLRLGLADVVRLAAERNAGVELERLLVAESEASVADEKSDLWPHLSVDVSHGNRTFNTASFGLDFPTAPGQEPLFDPAGEVLGPVTTADLRARVTQTLFDWSAIENVRSARKSLEADRLRTDVARERAAVAAAAAFVQARRAEGRLEARSADVALAEELLSISRDQLAAGTGVRLDVARAEAQLAALQSDVITARAEASRAALSLLRSLNLPLDTPLLLEEPGPPSAAMPETGDAIDAEVAAAVARRPDIAELDRRIAAAGTEVSAIRAERLPTLELSAGDGITGSSYSHLLNTYEWSLRVSVPVFDGFSRGSREDAGRARVMALEVRRRELIAQVDFEIRDGLLRLETATQLVASSLTRLELAVTEVEQARERFRAGESGNADVFTASLRVTEARTAAVDARAALDAARVTLAMARGGVLDLR